MKKIPTKLRNKIQEGDYYRTCARNGIDCKGRITIEHAVMVGGSQLNELWALIPLCAFHHAVDQYQDGGSFNKEINQLIALLRATDEELAQYPRAEFRKRRNYLAQKYEGFLYQHQCEQINY